MKSLSNGNNREWLVRAFKETTWGNRPTLVSSGSHVSRCFATRPARATSQQPNRFVSSTVQVTNSFVKKSEFREESPSELVDRLLQRTSTVMKDKTHHVVAFSGGVDSSLVLKLLHEEVSRAGREESVQAVLGISPAVPREQRNLARRVADGIGTDLIEITTEEGADDVYIANSGEACLACKTHLYSSLKAVLDYHRTEHRNGSGGQLYNGTNKDDTADPTRLGLIAAANFSVASPLEHTTKAEVRRAARHLGLPNWNTAASPCLRSRLALGVEATQSHLHMIDQAERKVRATLPLDQTSNMRVRMLARQRARVEVDHPLVPQAQDLIDVWSPYFQALGFMSVQVAPFKSGSVAKKDPGTTESNVSDREEVA